jgi:hypothetical protein
MANTSSRTAALRAFFGPALGSTIINAGPLSSDSESESESEYPNVTLEYFLAQEEGAGAGHAVETTARAAEMLQSPFDVVEQTKPSLVVGTEADSCGDDGFEDELEEASDQGEKEEGDKVRRKKKQENKRIRRLKMRAAAARVTISKGCGNGLQGLARFAYRFSPMQNFDYRRGCFTAVATEDDQEEAGR